MLRLLAALAVLVLTTASVAGPLSRWSATALPGPGKLAAGGSGQSTLAVVRDGADALRSTDGGLTWTTFTVRGQRPLDVSIAPADGRVWYAVTTADPILAAAPRVIWRSRDGGDTWEERSSVVNRYPLAPAVSADPEVLYLRKFDLPFCGFVCEGTSAHVVISRDGGASWTDPNPQNHAYRLAVSAADSRVALATMSTATASGFMRTQDGGLTWTLMRVPEPTMPQSQPDFFSEIALDRHDPLIAYARMRQNYSASGQDLYSTRDGGLTWRKVLAPEGTLMPDPVTAARVFIFAFDGRVLESRDAGLTWAHVDSGGSFHRLNDSFGLQDSAVSLHQGRLTAVFSGEQKIARLDLTGGALALGSDLWWNPSHSGEGITITQHPSNGMFVVWFTYGPGGEPVWRVMPGGTWHDRSLTGTLYETTGPAYFQGAFDPSRVASRAVGVATIDFRDQDNATFNFGSASGTVFSRTTITRQLFGDAARAAPDDFSDIWWNAAESGWGIGINQQGDRIFATWYVYGDDGKPLWIVMPDAPLTPEFVGAIVRPSARGDIYTTRGPAEGTPFDPSRVVSTKVGTARILFRGSGQADLEYTAFGRTATIAITRQPF